MGRPFERAIVRESEGFPRGPARSRGETATSGRRVARSTQQESAMLRRAATRSRGLHPGTCGHWRTTSRCVALSYSAYRPPRNSATTVYEPHTGRTVRVVPINRPEPRSVEDIVKYGVLSSEEERAALDNRRKVRMFDELARVHYDKPRMKVMLAHPIPNPIPNPNPKPKPNPNPTRRAWAAWAA